mmetsp:Transcript_30783/g.29399  ORF Transcript_30783/g.29399 Transcript_30783/m.29399 type:complete len:136 (+) Transcript_30783:61-468(+)
MREGMEELNNTYHLEIFSEYIHLKDFKSILFVPYAGKIAVTNDSFLVISDGFSLDKITKKISKNEGINTVIEFNEDSGIPTAMIWMTATVVCVGYDSGIVACFDIDGNTLFEKKTSPGSCSGFKNIRYTPQNWRY